MMDCKKALVEANGNFEKAIEILRKKGQKVASKRADRDSSEGVAFALVNDNNTKGIIVSINCETDFVAKNKGFITMTENIARLALGVGNLDELLSSTYEKSISVSEKLTEQTGIIGEKIEIGGFEILEAPFVNGYIHMGNKIASLVGLSRSVPGCLDVAKNIAMQVAAMAPIALDKDGVESSVIEKEIEIAKDQLRQEAFLKMRKEDLEGTKRILRKIKHPERILVKKQQGYYNYILGLISSQKNLSESERYMKKALRLGLGMKHDVAMAKLTLAGIAMQKRRKREATSLISEAKKLDKHNILAGQIKMIQQQLKRI
ncbi:elongation factor Ts [Elysia marginata]|uniref:Elongation factor Ts, mitochondrial n=1 Tax=Elysia marginata TaxID=1093978 RepID=A0AAV4GU02_9GAST|nr:elongation factor Ts [Elysia marginata]